jgi:ATP-dependent DNA ligase
MTQLNIYQILEQLEEAPGQNAKKALLQQHSENKLLQKVFKVVLDPYINFFLAKIPTVQQGPEREVTDYSMENILEVLNMFSTRLVTGNAARTVLSNTLRSLSPIERKWAERILLKKLRIGVSDHIFDLVWPSLIPRFSPALAKEVQWQENNGKITLDPTLQYPLRIEPKWDGFRCIAIKTNNEVKLYARSGKLFEDCPRIQKYLTQNMKNDFVLDGELMSTNWNDTASVAMSKKNKKDDIDMRYHVFDSVTFDDWTSKHNDEPYSVRIERLNDVAGITDGCPVNIAQGIIANNEQDIIQYYEHQLTLGYEGVMIKDLTSSYSFKRDNSLLKLKPIATYDGVVVDVLPAHEGTKWDGMYTILLVMLTNGVCTKVGSGFSDEDRNMLDCMRNKLVGRACETKGQPPLSDDGKIRFPRFVRWRENWDLSPEIKELQTKILNEVV